MKKSRLSNQFVNQRRRRKMALGKQVTEFSLKATSLTYTPGPEGTIIVAQNFEGTATDFGTVLGTGTATAAAGLKSGTWKWFGVAYLENGEIVTGTGQGTFASMGTHKWRTVGFNQLSDGRTVALEGEVNLATRTWSGKLYEWN
jgi:hypothetical protein